MTVGGAYIARDGHDIVVADSGAIGHRSSLPVFRYGVINVHAVLVALAKE